MRIYPFVFMSFFDVSRRSKLDETVSEASALTHAHERSRLCCKIYARVLEALLRAPSKESVERALSEASERYADSAELGAFSRVLGGGLASLDVREIKSGGYTVDTLEAALWCLLTTDGYAECVLRAVNLGEDTDTVAAVAGSLAGALYGYGAIPERWIKTLLRRELIEEICDRASRRLSR